MRRFPLWFRRQPTPKSPAIFYFFNQFIWWNLFSICDRGGGIINSWIFYNKIFFCFELNIFCFESYKGWKILGIVGFERNNSKQFLQIQRIVWFYGYMSVDSMERFGHTDTDFFLQSLILVHKGPYGSTG